MRFDGGTPYAQINHTVNHHRCLSSVIFWQQHMTMTIASSCTTWLMGPTKHCCRCRKKNCLRLNGKIYAALLINKRKRKCTHHHTIQRSRHQQLKNIVTPDYPRPSEERRAYSSWSFNGIRPRVPQGLLTFTAWNFFAPDLTLAGQRANHVKIWHTKIYTEIQT